MEQWFDPQYQFNLQSIEDMRAKEKLNREVLELKRCPGCGKYTNWSAISGGLRCSHCGFVATSEKYEQAIMDITMSRQYYTSPD